MAITYTWELVSFKKQTVGDLDHVIFQTYWKKIGTDENGLTAFFTGATPFDPAKVDPNNFTPYEELTQEIVLDWVKSVVVGDYETHVNGRIKADIDKQKNPEVEVGAESFPWATGGESTQTVTPVTDNGNPGDPA